LAGAARASPCRGALLSCSGAEALRSSAGGFGGLSVGDAGRSPPSRRIVGMQDLTPLLVIDDLTEFLKAYELLRK
jgi:hypothetical protein